MGLRLALGARPADLLQRVVGDGMRLVLLGSVAGLFGAYLLARWLESLLYGVGANDPVTMIVAWAILLFTALIACLVPARCAAQTDPIITLRHD